LTGAVILGDQHLVSDLHIKVDLFTVVVEFASTKGNDGAFLRLLFRRVRNNDTTLFYFLLFERLILAPGRREVSR
jgi:hypothetical protein